MSIVKDLEKLSKDLIYISETDGTFEVLDWSDAEQMETEDDLLMYLNLPANTFIRHGEVEDFLKYMGTIKDYHSEERKQMAKQYQQLQVYIDKNLANPIVFKVGEIEEDVYIVGENPDGGYVALKTFIVES